MHWISCVKYEKKNIHVLQKYAQENEYDLLKKLMKEIIKLKYLVCLSDSQKNTLITI